MFWAVAALVTTALIGGSIAVIGAIGIAAALHGVASHA